MRKLYTQQLEELRAKIVQMGQMCEQILSVSVDAITGGVDAGEAETAQIKAEIDDMEKDIEGLCMQLLLRQQPVASDLRMVSSALKIITDMERIGDQAENISEIVRFLGGRSVRECTLLMEMTRCVCAMVKESVDAFVSGDEALARRVISEDDTADELFVKVREKLVDMITANKADGEFAFDLFIIAKYFEKIGDHAVNIAGWVRFAVSGRQRAR